MTRFLDPSKNEDYLNILLHDTPVTLAKKSSKTGGPLNIKPGDKKTGKAKEIKIGSPVRIEGAHEATTSDLESVEINNTVSKIALNTRNSVYEIELADNSKANRQMSLLFLRRGYLDFQEKMPDGFYDGGRYTTFSVETDGRLVPHSPREIDLLHQGMDPALKRITENATKLLANIPDQESKIKLLALFVSNTLGGSQIVKLPGNDIEEISNREIAHLKAQSQNTNFILLGYLTHGVCRHRALLFKYLADRLGIPSRLVRGDQNNGAHQWNVVELKGKLYIVDVMQNPTELIDENSDTAKYYKRKGLRGLQGGFGGRSITKDDL
jgi:hypothetical protein